MFRERRKDGVIFKMVTIYNSELKKELQEGAKTQSFKEIVPSQLADKVVPVMEVNPKLLRRINLVKTAECNNATTATVYTTPSDKDFYLCGGNLSLIKDVTATSVRSGINFTSEGVGCVLLRIVGITLTVEQDTVSISLPYPVKVDRGTNITVTNSTNVGNVFSQGTIYGYIIDNAGA